jgi:hypothetical protein
MSQQNDNRLPYSKQLYPGIVCPHISNPEMQLFLRKKQNQSSFSMDKFLNLLGLMPVFCLKIFEK